jgi:hypothetical protein
VRSWQLYIHEITLLTRTSTWNYFKNYIQRPLRILSGQVFVMMKFS